MGKLILRLIRLFPKLEGEKNEEALMVGGGNQYKRSEISEQKGPLRALFRARMHIC